ncbi:MAG: hypothetical protein IT349_20035 [Candidatus Eisenbacteria bacterium]|nr:hypothetical protein [Candidatus Eisenbacteria bacterium]
MLAALFTRFRAPVRLGVARPQPWIDALPRLALALTLAGALPCDARPVRAALVINELLADPVGADRGAEWIELWNSGPWALSASGIVLEARESDAADGWRLLWAGQASDSIEVGRAFTVGGAYRARVPDVAVSLSLRNESDAVRLRKDRFVLDTVAWGTPDDEVASVSEGEPAARARPGLSLARREDGLDLDRNVADFAPADPSPGRPNHPDRDLSVRLQRIGRALPLGEATGEVEIRLVLENRGRSPIPSRDLTLWLSDSLGALAAPQVPDLGPGMAEGIPWRVPLRETGALIRLRGEARGDSIPENDLDTLRIPRADPPIRLVEVMARPDSAGAEWIELRAGRTCFVEGWSLEDASGIRLDLAPRALLADALLLLDARRLREAGSGDWPSLNDRAGSDGAADTLFLLDAGGAVVDWAVWGTGERGRSWVRDLLVPIEVGLPAWRTADPTPGELNPEAHSVLVDPRERARLSIERHPDGAWVRIPAELFPGRFDLRLLSLEGRELWREVGAVRGRSERWLRWNGRDPENVPCPVGVYLLDLALQPDAGAAYHEQTTLVLHP